jgi:hypothetical protein
MSISQAEIVAVKKRAAVVSGINLLFGICGMLLSLGEGSTAWALFIWLAALQGIALGLLAGPGWSDRLLDRTPVHRRSRNPLLRFALSVLSFWAPIFAMFIFGAIMAKTLPDAARPISSIEGNGSACMFQTWVTFFNAVGCAWLVVWFDTKKEPSTS